MLQNKTFRNLGLSAVLTCAMPLMAAAQGVERNTYIVMLEPGGGPAAGVAADLSRRNGGDVGYVYGALNGFSITLPDAGARGIANDPRVSTISREGERRIVAQTVPTGIGRTFADGNTSINIDGTDNFRVDVDVAILDTGIDVDHPDLNVFGGVNCVGGTCSGDKFSADDDEGHGTHVAGTVGAIDNDIDVVGMAPGARLWAVKVCDRRGRCPDSTVIAGIDWVVANHADEIEVINMSLSGPSAGTVENDPYTTAINAAVSAGVVIVVAAGNDGHDASNNSPAWVPNAITVSAMADFEGTPAINGAASCTTKFPMGYAGLEEHWATFSNYGNSIDIAAPGTCILSTKRGGGTVSNLGTSMAAPHVAGAAAVAASAYPGPLSGADVAAIAVELTSNGNLNWTDNSPDAVREPLLELTNAFIAATVPGGDGPDTVAPVPVIDTTASDPTQNATVPITVEFSETVTGFDEVDIVVTGGTVSGFGGSGASYSFDVTFASTNGGEVITIDIPADVAFDEAAIPNGNDAASTFSITYQAPPPPGTLAITSVTPYKLRGVQHVDLTWQDNAGNVDIRRDGVVVGSNLSGNSATDNIGAKGGGTYTYEVCETGTTTCSASAQAVF